MPPIVADITAILQRTSALLPLYLWGFFFCLSLIMVTIYPLLIAPLFNK
jgi:STE24 endopeptidase